MLRKVLIYPSCKANTAQEIINKAIAELQEDETLEFELMVENSTQVGTLSPHVYYTVVITLYDKEQ